MLIGHLLKLLGEAAKRYGRSFQRDPYPDSISRAGELQADVHAGQCQIPALGRGDAPVLNGLDGLQDEPGRTFLLFFVHFHPLENLSTTTSKASPIRTGRTLFFWPDTTPEVLETPGMEPP